MERRVLINKYAKDMITKYSKEYPNISWYLTMKGGQEYVVGFDEGGNPIVMCKKFEDVKTTLEIRNAIRKIKIA